MKKKEKLFDILLKVSELRMDIETAEKRILRLFNTIVAEHQVKNCSIPDVVVRSEQLKAFADYAQKRMWEDGDKYLSEFVEEFLSL